MSQTTDQLDKPDAGMSPDFTVTGPILAKYDSLGGATGLLGAAQSNVTTCPDGVGQFVRFANGWATRSAPSSATRSRTRAAAPTVSAGTIASRTA
jgi:uncharacterized protein with LGFP repeats